MEEEAHEETEKEAAKDETEIQVEAVSGSMRYIFVITIIGFKAPEAVFFFLYC